MDKSDVKVHENHSDTSSVITMKEYAPSEYPSSEPPPAYIKPRSNALRIAKLAAFTVIVSSVILGGFILAASWIQANTARNLDLTLNQELLDDLHPNYEHLIANEVLPEQQHNSLDQSESKTESADDNQVSSNAVKLLDKINQSNEEGLVPPPPPPPAPEKPEEKRVLDMDEIANILMQKNIKGNVNCIVEKRRNEELVDHAPMFLNLPSSNTPFGLNISTPPRLQHLTGERMIVICKGDDDDEEKESSSEENENEKAGDVQSIVFPLPNHLINHVQQVPQLIPLNTILQHLQVQQPVRQLSLHQLPMQVQQLPMQPIQMQQIPVQQIPVHQVPVQQIQIQHVPLHLQQIPVQRINMPHFQPQPQLQPQFQQQPIPQPQQIIFHHPIMPEQQQQQQQRPQPIPQFQQLQQQPQQILFPQKVFSPQPQFVSNQRNVPLLPEMIPLKEIAINQNRIPVNHVLHHRVPINPMATNDIPISRMQITHLPLRAEPQIKEEPVPVHHLMPPQPQQPQPQIFRPDEPRFNERPVQIFPPQPNPMRPLPVEVNDPGVLRAPAPLAQEPRERFPMPPRPNQLFPHNLVENREPEFAEENRAFRPLTVDVRPRGQRKEPMLPEISKIIPLNFERRPMDNGRKIRFPDMPEPEHPRENRMPIITEITKIIPIRLEKEEADVNEAPINQPKNIDVPDIKLEKMPPRPFPIPINAILDMIFKGIRPLMGNRGHPFPIPIDIKIERIDNKPLMGMPFLKKFEVIKKESQDSMEEDAQNPQTEDKTESEENEENDKDVVEAKVERVEVFDGEHENGHPIPIPADAQDPQVFKVEEQGKDVDSSFEEQAFLPNGQGRGARVFPIPQVLKEAEIFSVFDAKSDQKNIEAAEVPVGSSLTVAGNADGEKAPESADNRQSRLLDFPNPFINLFPIPENKEMKGAAPETRSLKLVPVSDAGAKAEDMKQPVPEANMEEVRPHFVQPRSV